MRALYLLLIASANLTTAKFNPITLAGGALIIPAGSLFAGVVFILRDLVQLRHGRRKAYTTILWAAAISAALSAILGDVPHVAAAGVIAFFASEALDTEIFSRMKKSLPARVLLSGVVGGCLDSVIFVVLGLSPIGADVLPWSLVPFAILGQILVKVMVQAVAAVYLILRTKGGRENDATT